MSQDGFANPAACMRVCMCGCDPSAFVAVSCEQCYR